MGLESKKKAKDLPFCKPCGGARQMLKHVRLPNSELTSDSWTYFYCVKCAQYAKSDEYDEYDYLYNEMHYEQIDAHRIRTAKTWSPIELVFWDVIPR